MCQKEITCGFAFFKTFSTDRDGSSGYKSRDISIKADNNLMVSTYQDWIYFHIQRWAIAYVLQNEIFFLSFKN